MKKIMIVLMIFCGINVNAMETWNRIESGQEAMPLYSVIDGLNRASASNGQEACEQYAKMVAKLALSEKTLEELRQQASDHWLTTLAPEAKELIYQYMPKMREWVERRAISYDRAGIITFAPRSKKITVISEFGKAVDILDSETGRSLHSYADKSWKDFDDGRVRSASLSSDDARIAIASEDKTAIVAEVNTGNILCTVEHAAGVYSATFSSDDKELITLTHAGVRRVTDIASGEMLSRVRYFDNMTDKMDLDTISPDGKTIAVRGGGMPGKFGRKSRIIQADTRKHLYTIGNRPLFGRIDPIYTSDSTKVVATCDYHPKRIKIIDLAKTPIKEHVLEYDNEDNHFYDNSINFSSDGSLLAINRGEGLLDIVDTHSGLVEHSLEVRSYFAGSASFSSDNSELAVGFPQEVKVFRAVSAVTLDQALLMHLRKHCAKKKEPVLPASLPWVTQVAETLYGK